MVSTTILLRNAIGSSKLHADSTFKLVWQNYPIIVVGTTDRHKKFHPFGIAVSTNETAEDYQFIYHALKSALFNRFTVEFKPQYLIADAAWAIRNAFMNEFGGGTVIMCWFHVLKGVDPKAKSFLPNQLKQNQFFYDLQKLQLCPSREMFEKCSELFIQKWNSESTDLMNYFRENWIDINSNWFEGVAKCVPSTNNALESFNLTIKNEQTFRERLEMSLFREKLVNMVKQWSTEYDAGLNEIHHNEPNISLEIWTKGYNWAKSNVQLTTIAEGDRCTYIPRGMGELHACSIVIFRFYVYDVYLFRCPAVFR